MPGIWGIVKIAATKIPWGRVLENVPAAVEMMGRAKERFRGTPGSAHGSMEERVRLLQAENQKLEKALLQSSEHLQETIKTLRVVLARQKMLTLGTVLSLALSASALMLVIFR